MPPGPLYEVINRDIAQQIIAGSLKPGERLLSEAELAKYYGVSRMTLRQALARLETDGLVTRRHGSGTYVTESLPIRRRGNELGSFHEEIGIQSYAIKTTVLAVDVRLPSADTARRLALSENQQTLRIERLRFVSGRPISLQESWVPYMLAPSLAHDGLVEGSLYQTLAEREGIEIVKASQQVTAALVTATQARKLDVSVGSPIIEINRTSYGPDNKPIEAAHSFTLPEIPFEFHLER